MPSSSPWVLRSFFFFFSSRRRHTISDRDWSSDVCSSDPRLNSSHDQISYAVFCLKQKFRCGSAEHTSELQSPSALVCLLLRHNHSSSCAAHVQNTLDPQPSYSNPQ